MNKENCALKLVDEIILAINNIRTTMCKLQHSVSGMDATLLLSGAINHC